MIIKAQVVKNMNSEIVFNTLLLHAKDNGVALTHIKVQSLLYLLHGFYLARTGEHLLDEPFEAWPHGVVIRNIYSQLMRYGNGWVREFLELEDKETGRSLGVTVVCKTNLEFFDVLTLVWDAYGELNEKELFLTVRTKFNEPWLAVKWRHGIITNESIFECFIKNLSEMESEK